MTIGETIFIQSTGDVTKTSNTTLVSAGIPFTVVAGEEYAFQYNLGIIAGSGGFAHEISVPSGSSGDYSFQGATQIAEGSGLTVGSPYGKTGAAVDVSVNRLVGKVVAGGNGTVDLKFAQNISTIVSTVVKATSGVFVTRLS